MITARVLSGRTEMQETDVEVNHNQQSPPSAPPSSSSSSSSSAPSSSSSSSSTTTTTTTNRKRRRASESPTLELTNERAMPSALAVSTSRACQTTYQAPPMPAVAPDYAAGVLHIMRQLREQGRLCDVVVRSGSTEVRAHRLVLAACSEYFRACLTGPMMESEEKVVTLAGMDEEALEELVNFAYCGKVHLTEESVLELLVAANRLQMPQVVQQCCDFLLQRMDGANCLGILSIANTYHCSSMRQRAEAFIHRHFELVYQSEEFLGLSLEQVLTLLSSEAVSLASEETVFTAAVRWVMHDRAARAQHILSLLRTVRLELVATSFIADVIHQHELVQRCPEAQGLLLQAYRYHNSARADVKADVWTFVRKKAIRPAIYCIGGDDGIDDRSPYDAALCLDTQLERWQVVASLRHKRSVCGVATLNGRIVVVGGYNGERAVEAVEEFDPQANTWRSLAPIGQRRCSCGCAVLDGQLYVVGGVCGPLALSEVEVYDADKNVWTAGVPMQDGRSGCGVAELGGLLYAVGGINASGDTVATAEALDPKAQRWASIQPMHAARRSFGLAALGGLLYACGGNDGVSDLKSLEVYDPRTNRWSMRTPMRHARMYCSVAVLDGRLYAVGGLDGTEALDSVEMYDPATDTWAQAAPLPRRVCGCGLTVMDCVRSNAGAGPEEGEGGLSSSSSRKGGKQRAVPLLVADPAGGAGCAAGTDQQLPQPAAGSSSSAPQDSPSAATN